MPEKEISRAVIRRLPRYYRYLGELLEQKIERISSGELSKLMRVTASQIRQDLNNFGGFGQQGYGYNVPYLREEIGKILGIDQTQKMILLGAGNLGQAIVKSNSFAKSGFEFVGLFDVDESLRGKTVNGLPVRMIDELPDFLKEHPDVRIAALTLPKESVPETAKQLVKHGIRAIWNFAHIDLNFQLPPEITVENVHIADSLMRLSYNLNRKNGKKM